MQLARHLGGKELYDCIECEKRPALKQMLGHDGPPTTFWREHLLTGDALRRCPVREILDAPAGARAEVDELMGLLMPAYDAGHLLAAGGLADQPARYVEMIQLVRATRARVGERVDELEREQSA